MKSKRNTVNIALFASGSGTNVENIYNYFKNNSYVNISCVLCNKANAYVLTRAAKLNIDFMLFSREDFNDSDRILTYLTSKNVDLIVLAGFLWMIPQYLIDNYLKRIVNIHPALLPKYGGKGMYGDIVHKAVFENKETTTGITIHYVNSKYDEGEIIFQKSIRIDKSDKPETIANKVHELEYKYYPEIIEKIAVNLQNEIYNKTSL
ncbi:MAG: phosphoribosylglycinamide formyltransferase [Bacteroidales bacterium]|nr:phosphoribosylglycinamide formyltransferase [Bacteroidales bacterium]